MSGPGQPGSGPPVRDLSTRTVLAGLSALGTTLAVMASGLIAGRAVQEGAGTYADATYAHWSVAAFDFTGRFAGVGFVAAWVTTGLWLYRARRNAEVISPAAPHARARAWSWAGWVVPVVNLWFPYQVVRDVRRASDPRPPPPALLGWWWALWLTTVIAYRLSRELTEQALRAGGSASTATVLGVASAVLALLALVQWGLVMRSIVVPQQQRFRLGRVVP